MNITKADKIEEPKQVEKLVELVESAPKEDEELSNIIDDAIKEVEEKETKEDFKLKQEDINDIKNFLVHLKDIGIENKNNFYKSMIEILKETHYIKKNQTSNNKLTYSYVLLAGICIGLTDEKWMPFAKFGWDFFTTIIGKG